MKSIAIIMPYFGKWPVWKDLFFNSCSSNKDIDFFFFTDCGIPEQVSQNLHFTEVLFEDYCKVISQSLNIQFNPSSPRKLCDVRPFYGVIHEELLKNYDFWGYGDVDLVFGNIRQFYTDELLEKYDVLSTHFDRLSGHLAIIKNNDYYRTLCFSMRNWESELLCERNRILDESEFSYQIIPELRVPRYIYAKTKKYIGWKFARNIQCCFFPRFHKWLDTDKRRVYFREMNIHPDWTGSQDWLYLPGSWEDKVSCRVFDRENDEECIYCHFLPYKNEAWQKPNAFGDLNCKVGCRDAFRITDQGISVDK